MIMMPYAEAGPSPQITEHADFRQPTGSGPQISPSGLNENTPQALASLDALTGIGAGLLPPCHGEPWPGPLADALAQAKAAGRS
jgi:hypothetical protein